MAGPSPGHPRHPAREEYAWITGTSPVMTVARGARSVTYTWVLGTGHHGLDPANDNCCALKKGWETRCALMGVMHLGQKAPAQGLAGTEGDDGRVAGADAIGHRPGFAAQAHVLAVGRQPIKGGAVQRGERFEMVERAFVGKDLGIEIERRGGGEHAGAAASGFLGRLRVRRAVGAEKEMRV